MSVLSLIDVTNSFELQQKQKFNLTRNHLVLVAASGVLQASSFKGGFSLICFLKFNQDEVELRVLKI